MRIAIARLFVAVLVGLSIPVVAAASDQATEIGKLAASMKPGEWKELNCSDYDFATLMRGEDILAYKHLEK